jgi:hypothetical protein
MKKLITPTALLVVLVVLVWDGAALGHSSTVRVSGLQAALDKTAGAPGDPCAATDPKTGTAPKLINAMAGSLVGCWYTDTLNITLRKPNGIVHATGREHFVGCLDTARAGHCTRADPTGTLALTATFELKFDHAKNEIWGRCQHPIVSGTGAFRGATGRINFTDNVTNGTATYRGHITLAGRHKAAGATAADLAPAATPSTSTC